MMINVDKQTVDFSSLVLKIQKLHSSLQITASKSVNMMLTLRNWMIGYYIAEYELNGSDRAEYGSQVIELLANELQRIGISRSDKRELYRYLKFYKTYPKIVEAVSPQLQDDDVIELTLSKRSVLSQTLVYEIVDSASPQLYLPAGHLFTLLSFTHFLQLLDLESVEKREFYQSQCIRGNWSVRELTRQIQSLLYERSVLSTNKRELQNITDSDIEPHNPLQAIRDPYVFEFLGLPVKEVVSESHLEAQLLNNLQDFLLELGHGFCFEAKQKRILIGNTQFYIDLVFYHRILKCHILIELKVAGFNHENIGQLNTYVSWYRTNEMREDDNPPIGILLCTDKDSALVEYALAGMDNTLFVSKYLLKLPSKEEMQAFLEESLKQKLLG